MTPIEKIDKETLKELYDKDFPLWAEINYQLLKEKAYELVDWENLLEEIEDMARKHLDSAISHLAVILEHLYKLDHFRGLAGGETAGSGWVKSVLNARDRLERLITKYPSLRQKVPAQIQEAWKDAITELRVWLRENEYDPDRFSFPEECPYTYEEAMKKELK